jgi:hypothetical protein
MIQSADSVRSGARGKKSPSVSYCSSVATSKRREGHRAGQIEIPRMGSLEPGGQDILESTFVPKKIGVHPLPVFNLNLSR